VNSIPARQNSQEELDRLAAYTYIYTQAKRVAALRMAMAVVPTVVWAMVVAAHPQLKGWAAASGIAITMLDLGALTSWQQLLQFRGAKVQELFDADLLGLDWREYKVDRRPDPEEVAEASARYKRRHLTYSRLRNWYPTVVGRLPLPLARIVCQRCSSWWDAKLRRKYAVGVLILLGILTAFVGIVGLAGKFSVENLVLTVLNPLLPAFSLGIRQYTDQREAAANSDRHKRHLEDLWAEALTGQLTEDELTRGSRELQDEIYNRRRQSPLIFNWVYSLSRDDFERQMQAGARHMVDDALARGLGGE